ncbi:MAG TPA: response regulator transcription factor [Frankiaceae bacterium]|nr:response regulator transcription factor [Frankiaceae bacterium]
MTCAAPHRRGTVLLVEDHQLLAQSLSLALTAEGFAATIAPLNSQAGILETFEWSAPGIVLLDLDLGGAVGDGLALVRPLCDRGGRVLVVSGCDDRPRLAACLEQGAVAILPKSTPYERLVDAVVEISAGRRIVSESDRHAMLGELRAWRARQRHELAPFETLTTRESQVLAALMDGQGCEAIASAWFVSEATVRTQIRGVLTKLGVSSQLAAAALAQRVGWKPSPAG